MENVNIDNYKDVIRRLQESSAQYAMNQPLAPSYSQEAMVIHCEIQRLLGYIEGANIVADTDIPISKRWLAGLQEQALKVDKLLDQQFKMGQEND